MGKSSGGAKRRRSGPRKKTAGGGRPLVLLVVVVILIVSAISLLELVRQRAPRQQPVPPGASERLKIPPRPVPPPLQPQVSAARAVPAEPRIPPRKVAPGSVAIIIDDMGANLDEAQRLLAIHMPFTFSIIPGLARSRGVATLAHERGVQVMVHIPMEPIGYPKKRMEKIGLLVGESDDAIARQVAADLADVPYAVGANNHMGSLFTENGEKMRVVLRILKERGFFFIDSKTSPKSVAYAEAKRLGLRAASRQVFLDNKIDVAAVTSQLEEVAAIARKRGSAIAICHPHLPTIEALAEAMPRLAREGITFVHVSALVR